MPLALNCVCCLILLSGGCQKENQSQVLLVYIFITQPQWQRKSPWYEISIGESWLEDDILDEHLLFVAKNNSAFVPSLLYRMRSPHLRSSRRERFWTEINPSSIRSLSSLGWIEVEWLFKNTPAEFQLSPHHTLDVDDQNTRHNIHFSLSNGELQVIKLWVSWKLCVAAGE